MFLKTPFLFFKKMIEFHSPTHIKSVQPSLLKSVHKAEDIIPKSFVKGNTSESDLINLGELSSFK